MVIFLSAEWMHIKLQEFRQYDDSPIAADIWVQPMMTEKVILFLCSKHIANQNCLNYKANN